MCGYTYCWFTYVVCFVHVYRCMCVYMQSHGSPLLCSVWVSADRSWFNTVLEELAIKHFCVPRDDPKTEMAAISEEPPLVS